MNRIRHGIYLLIERLLTWCVHPGLRARLLSLFGARIGRNVRVYDARFFNLENGFTNLQIEDDCYIGPGCMLDLKQRISLGCGSVISTRTIILTHLDVGSKHGAPLLKLYPVELLPVHIGPGCFVGAGSIILAGAKLGRNSMVAAGSVVKGEHPPGRLLAGSPAVSKRELDIPKE